MELPIFKLFRRRETSDLSRNQQFLDVFGGYNHNLRIREGEWYDETHMSAMEYPLLRTSPNRAEVRSVTDPGGQDPGAMRHQPPGVGEIPCFDRLRT